MTTITEALAELKTIAARIAKKQTFIQSHLIRDTRLRDPNEKDGGSGIAIQREYQAIADLRKRVIAIRTAIAKSNLTTSANVNGRTMSIAEWLTWRRDLSEGEKSFNSTILGDLRMHRDKIMKSGYKTATSDTGQIDPNTVIINVDESELSKEAEEHEKTLGELDGKLSLLNAVTQIDI